MMDDRGWTTRGNRRSVFYLPSSIFVVLCLATFASPAQAGWLNGDWTFRRTVDVSWDSDRAEGNELADVEFYTAGHHNADGSDLRVTTDDGRIIPSHVLTVGPGDKVSVVFALQKGGRRYTVYFGNPKPPEPPKGTEDVKYACGLLLETRTWTGGATRNPEELEASFERSRPVIGRAMVDRPFVGPSPFGEQRQTMSKYQGMIGVPVNGDYLFAAAAETRGALFLDDKPVLFAPNAPADTRYHQAVHLDRGRHAFAFYQLHDGGDPKVSVGWKRPDMPKVQVIGRDALGVVSHGGDGPLEEFHKTLTADAGVEYLGECFVGGNYSHRLRFTARVPKGTNATASWDFGDGLEGTGLTVEHVFVTEGVYPVRLTAHIGANADAQTFRVYASRDFAHLDNPPTDEPPVHAKIAAGYVVDGMPLRWLPWATLLELRGGEKPAMLKTAARLAAEKSHPDANGAYDVLKEVTKSLRDGPQLDAAVGLWDAVPTDSDLQPRAARFEGDLLLWWAADFAKAAERLAPFAGGNETSVKRVYAEALILAGKAAEGRKVIDALPDPGELGKQAAISGAMARTVEFFVDNGDYETGEDDWEKWVGKYPATFLEGYAVLLRTKLMEARKATAAAAKVAEAFASAVPQSPYAPQLLDRASKLLAKTDPAKSKELRTTLKQRYPEDPLSQDAK